MSFESELKKGNFMVQYCPNCKETVWPPSKFCNKCFDEIVLREGPKEGTIIEFSKEKDTFFCIGKFDEIKIVGRIISGIPKEGKPVRIQRCGIKNKDYFFDMKVV